MLGFMLTPYCGADLKMELDKNKHTLILDREIDGNQHAATAPSGPHRAAGNMVEIDGPVFFIYRSMPGISRSWTRFASSPETARSRSRSRVSSLEAQPPGSARRETSEVWCSI